MPTYRWTLTCEEMLNDENNTVNITTKTLVSESESFTDVLILLPQLFNGVGFFVEPNSFSYKDETFEDWSYEKEETGSRVIERDYSPPGFRDEVPYADPGLQVTGHPYCVVENVDFLAGFPPTMSEE